MTILTVQDMNALYRVKMDSGEIVCVPKSPDNRHYKMVQEYVLAGGIVDPPDPWAPTLAAAKARRIKEINSSARDILSGTDWYVVRKTDDGTAIPDDITAYRAAVRAAAQTAATAINALSGIDAVRDCAPGWPIAPGE